MGGVISTIKLFSVVKITPLRSTDTGPVVAPAGTEVVSSVEVAAVTVATVPLNFTMLSAGVVLKSVPVRVTVVPGTATAGLKLIMVNDGITVKSDELATVTPLTVTEIFPDVAPTGTLVVRLVVVEAVTVEVVPLNRIT